MTDIVTNLAHSASAAAVAELITLPITTIKTNYQNSTETIPQVVSRIWGQHGMRGFYNSSGVAMVSQVTSTAAKYTWYCALNEYVSNRFLAGTMAGALTSFLTHPMDVVKVHQQMHTPLWPRLQEVGPSLLYRGYSKTLSKYAISSTFYFPLYDTMQEHTPPMLAAIISATVSTLIIQPIDYMKIRHIDGQPWFHGWSPRPYFRGVGLNLARSVPQFTLVMAIIEGLKESPERWVDS